MLEVYNKLVPESLSELVALQYTALIIVDMQNDCCSEGGSLHQAGGGLSMYPEMIPRLKRLLEAAREQGVLVVFIQNTTLDKRASDSPAQIRFTMRANRMYSGSQLVPLEYTLDGTWGHQIIEELEPLSGELVVKKFRSSAFIATNLDLLLRSNGIKSVIVTGCTTEGCVDSTIRDAGFYDYFVIVPEDCTASDSRELHDAAIFILRAYRADVVSSAEILQAWSSD